MNFKKSGINNNNKNQNQSQRKKRKIKIRLRKSWHNYGKIQISHLLIAVNY